MVMTPERLFRAHVGDGSPDQSARVLGPGMCESGQAEIDQLRLTFVVDQDIRGLDILMDDLLGTDGRDRLRHLATNHAARRGPGRYRSA